MGARKYVVPALPIKSRFAQRACFHPTDLGLFLGPLPSMALKHGLKKGRENMGVILTANHLYTLPETNIAPKNGWLEYYFPFRMAYFHLFSGALAVSFREGTSPGSPSSSSKSSEQ